MCSIASHSALHTAYPHRLPLLPEAACGAEGGAGAFAPQNVTLFIDDVGPPASAFNGGNNGLIYSGSSLYGCGRRPSRCMHASACAKTSCAPLNTTLGVLHPRL